MIYKMNYLLLPVSYGSSVVTLQCELFELMLSFSFASISFNQRNQGLSLN